MFYYIVFLYYHQFLFNFFCKENDTSSANNIVSLSHASFSVLATVSYFITSSTQIYLFINTFSIGYFLFDIFYMLRYKNLNFFYYCMIYHHMVSIYGFSIPEDYYQIEMLFWAELSNLPSYFVYNAIKRERKNLKKIKRIQLFFYGIIRVFVIGYYLYLNYFYSIDLKIFYLMIPIYLMGLGWISIMFSKYF